MTRCSQGGCRDGRDVHLYRLPVHGLTSALCAACVASLVALGMDWRLERRSDPQRPDRGPLPAWRQRIVDGLGRGKDLTGSVR